MGEQGYACNNPLNKLSGEENNGMLLFILYHFVSEVNGI